jgi:hypothetical protein
MFPSLKISRRFSRTEREARNIRFLRSNATPAIHRDDLGAAPKSASAPNTKTKQKPSPKPISRTELIGAFSLILRQEQEPFTQIPFAMIASRPCWVRPQRSPNNHSHKPSRAQTTSSQKSSHSCQDEAKAQSQSQPSFLPLADAMQVMGQRSRALKRAPGHLKRAFLANERAARGEASTRC